MIYTDLHCDTLTACADNGYDLYDCPLHTSFEKLIKSGYIAQCFAIFTDGENAAKNYENYLAFYKRALEKHKDIVAPILNTADLARAESGGKLGCILTCENLGFLGNDAAGVSRLKQDGVKMASLVWNNKNAFASPNLITENGLPYFEKRENAGLTPLGKEVAERLDELKIIIDISHLSDGGAAYLLQNRKIPLVASHSNAERVCNVSRNLTDELIKKIADCGGVAGINFCADFLGGEAFESAFLHISHLIKIGGEDVVALGSDFDGIPTVPNLEECTRVPKLFEYLEKRKIPQRVLEKLAYKNFVNLLKNFD